MARRRRARRVLVKVKQKRCHAFKVKCSGKVYKCRTKGKKLLCKVVGKARKSRRKARRSRR